jgi:hypothetical protein
VNTEPDGKATSVRQLFSLETTVAIRTQATPERIWAVLTNAPDYPRWNSTILSLEGNMEEGKTVILRAADAPKRTFNIRVTKLVPNEHMVWEDGNWSFGGIRHFVITPTSGGAVDVRMTEKFSGPLSPLVLRMLPPQVPQFEKFMADLKTEVETKPTTGQ